MYKIGKLGWKSIIIHTLFHIIIFLVPLAKFDTSLKNTPPGLAPFCTESWQRFPPIFSQFLLRPQTWSSEFIQKFTGKTRKTKEIYRKTRKPLRRREVQTPVGGLCPIFKHREELKIQGEAEYFLTSFEVFWNRTKSSSRVSECTS